MSLVRRRLPPETRQNLIICPAGALFTTCHIGWSSDIVIVQRDLASLHEIDKTTWSTTASSKPIGGEPCEMAKVLVIDDDRTICEMVKRSLEKIDVTTVTAETASDGLAALPQENPDVVVLDIMLPQTSGLELFRDVQQHDRRLPIIFITAGGGSSTAIQAMQLGAYDYVNKPLDLPKLNQVVQGALETRRLMNQRVAISTGDANHAEGEIFVGRSPKMLEVFKAVGRVASQDVTVLIRGESGTGKELVARAIYQHSKRSEQPFMAVNCAAIPDALLESELFGHEKGSFTGADQRRIGKFEQCNGGTIFLDEVGDMSPLVQGKVLRLLQEQKFERVGGNQTIQTDVRIITATNRDLEQMVEDGEYRADLMYRLNGVTIKLPPVRERGDDIEILVEHFLNIAAEQLGKGHVEGISPEALELLIRYDWPGNVRELQSVVRTSLLNTTGPIVVPAFLPANVRRESGGDALPEQVAASDLHHTGSDDQLPSADLGAFVEGRLRSDSTDLYSETLEVMERFLLTRVLQETDGNQTRAAEILGITRGKIRDRIAAFKISLDKKVTLED